MSTDTFVVRMVVGILGVIAIGALATIAILANRQLGIPDALIAIESASLGAIGGLLAKTSTEPAEGGQSLLVVVVGVVLAVLLLRLLGVW